MSYQLHYAKHYAPDWVASVGNPDQWADLFREKFYDNGWMNDDETEYEAEKSDIKDYIQELLKAPSENNKFYTEYSNADIARDLQEIVDGCEDETVHMEWF